MEGGALPLPWVAGVLEAAADPPAGVEDAILVTPDQLAIKLRPPRMDLAYPGAVWR